MCFVQKASEIKTYDCILLTLDYLDVSGDVLLFQGASTLQAQTEYVLIVQIVYWKINVKICIISAYRGYLTNTILKGELF